MSWREQLQPGKFRDVFFLIDAHDLSGGRRLAVHEYPFQDMPYTEDLGRSAREFSLECYVLGADYMLARDNLVAAFEKKGSGTLIHPYLGTKRVSVRSYRLRESSREGGIARLSVSFIESGENIQPSATIDTQSTVISRVDSASLAIQTDFADTFTTKGYPEFVTTEATSQLNKAMAAIDAARASLPGVPAELTAFNADLNGVSDSLSSLINQPASLASSFVSLLVGIASVTQGPSSALAGYRHLFNFGSSEKSVAPTTPSRTQQKKNQAAVISLVRRAAVVEAVRSSSQMTFASYNDALVVRDELADLIDTESETADDDTYVALMDLRTALVNDITAREANLAQIITWTPKATLPALVVAHQIYGDASRASDIVNRNQVSHPGFIPGGTELEVLTDA